MHVRTYTNIYDVDIYNEILLTIIIIATASYTDDNCVIKHRYRVSPHATMYNMEELNKAKLNKDMMIVASVGMHACPWEQLVRPRRCHEQTDRQTDRQTGRG